MNVKQIIVIRKDLNMRKGKMCAQASHASMAFLTKEIVEDGSNGLLIKSKYLSNFDKQELLFWLKGSFTKICVSVDSEKELIKLYTKALDAGLHAEMIIDNGLTEFNGVPTRTCIAIGPHYAEKLQPITGNLKLL